VDQEGIRQLTKPQHYRITQVNASEIGIDYIELLKFANNRSPIEREAPC
jgi:hypothetical protein